MPMLCLGVQEDWACQLYRRRTMPTKREQETNGTRRCTYITSPSIGAVAHVSKGESVCREALGPRQGPTNAEGEDCSLL